MVLIMPAMAVLVVVNAVEEAPALVRWGMRLAHADDHKIAVAVLEPVRGNTEAAARLPFVIGLDQEHESSLLATVRGAIASVRDTADASDEDESSRAKVPTLHWLRHGHPVGQLLELIAELDIQQVLVGKRDTRASDHEHDDVAGHLLERCSCRVLVIRAVAESGETCRRILVPAAGGPHAREALRMARSLSKADPGISCDVLYVQAPGAPDADGVGTVHIDRVLRESGCQDAGFTVKVVVDAKPRQVIGKLAGDYDLVVVGASDRVFIQRMLFSTVPDQMLAGPTATAVAVLRRAERPHARWLKLIEGTLLAHLPQMDRTSRLDLTDRLQCGSVAGVDYMALIVLATAIAGLGLIADSTAVVVGAMLVAPLMTPIVGAGLGLVQGNLHLVRIAFRSIIIGFLLALMVGCLLGWTAAPEPWTGELAARGRPGLLDLFVALFSGMAAAYAQARPGLSAALPGVAIAAALVPPIATVGISLTAGRWANAEGAALLFVTNVITIIIGTALALYAIGLRPSGGRGWIPRWVGRLFIALLVAVLVLVVPLSLDSGIGRRQAHAEAEIHQWIAGRAGMVLLDELKIDRTGRMLVRLASSVPITSAEVAELRGLFDEDLVVIVLPLLVPD